MASSYSNCHSCLGHFHCPKHNRGNALRNSLPSADFPKNLMENYFLGRVVLTLGLTFGLDASTFFMGAAQQTISQSLQPHTSSTKTTSPQASHLYLSPLFFAKTCTSKLALVKHYLRELYIYSFSPSINIRSETVIC